MRAGHAQSCNCRSGWELFNHLILALADPHLPKPVVCKPFSRAKACIRNEHNPAAFALGGVNLSELCKLLKQLCMYIATWGSANPTGNSGIPVRLQAASTLSHFDQSFSKVTLNSFHSLTLLTKIVAGLFLIASNTHHQRKQLGQRTMTANTCLRFLSA